jgi:hypothetical protein
MMANSIGTITAKAFPANLMMGVHFGLFRPSD